MKKTTPPLWKSYRERTENHATIIPIDPVDADRWSGNSHSRLQLLASYTRQRSQISHLAVENTTRDGDRGCVGRKLFPMIRHAFSNCAWLISAGVLRTNHVTISEHGGVVRDPLYA